MATQPEHTAMLDTSITIKVVLNDIETRRFKLALKDLGPSVLPDKLRSLLGVPTGQDVLFERFSDSAGAFIKLDSTNSQVYKQLLRAAKAKLRLRIRATYLDKDGKKLQFSALGPIPVSAVQPVTALSSHAPSAGTAAPVASAHPAVEPRIQLPSRQKPAQVDPQKLSLLDMDVPMGRSTASSAPKMPEMQRKPCVSKLPGPSARVHPGLENLVDGFGSQYVYSEAPLPAEFCENVSCEGPCNQYPVLCHPIPGISAAPGQSFSICCNKCDASIHGPHWHCGICDNGDFDLCQSCFAQGVRCDNVEAAIEHWLIQRSVRNGKVVMSDTERYTPKRTADAELNATVPGPFTAEIKTDLSNASTAPTRTCNSCISVFNEANFVTCTTCEDYDLCLSCHMNMKHGHHPGHSFIPASDDATMDEHALNLCTPGRYARHRAVCDGCDQDIRGIRHKCLTCPDWDYCSTCVATSHINHPGHSFLPVYESLCTRYHHHQQSVYHRGIQCDGPLCQGKHGKNYIIGDRYKCAVCHDTDFCAACEALPTEHHNKTHPLIKFRTPVRNVSVTALHSATSGQHLSTLGDRAPQTSSKSTETLPAAPSVNAAVQVQTVAEVPPTVPVQSTGSKQKAVPPGMLDANFVRDAVSDGSLISPGATFKQVWTLRNVGRAAWPAGCSVRFIGGDSMFDLDINQPISVHELAMAQSSNSIDRVVAVGEEIEFSVMMRASTSVGKNISYWRLKTAEGLPFGHKLWCDITVEGVEAAGVVSEEPAAAPVAAEGPPMEQSVMIFPTLDKESPVASVHEATVPTDAATPIGNTVEDGTDEVEFDDESSDEGFLTDEEYEVLSADEEDMPEARNGKRSMD